MTQTKAVAPIEEIKGQLARMSESFKAALPPHITPEKFIRITQTAIQNNPDLVSVDRRSLYGAVMKAAQDGLLPDGREAAIVKYGDKAQYQPMIGGLLKKVRNSGELSSITAQVIFEKDKFRYWVDIDGEHLDHEPNLFSDRGKPIGVYALAKMKDGGVYIEAMTVAQVMAIKNASRSKDKGPWAGAFEHEMWRKSAMRRLCKRLPMSTDLPEILMREDDEFEPTPQAQPQAPQQPEPEAEEPKPKTKTSRVGKIIEAQSTPVAEPAAEAAPPDADAPDYGGEEGIPI